MSHFAEIDENNIVIRVVVGDKTISDSDALKWCQQNLGGIWVQTSYNTRGGVYYDPNTVEPSADQSKALRKNYASVGYTYDAGRDAFIPPKPYASWLLNEDTCLWDAPVAMPADAGTGEPPKRYTWDEATTNWLPVSE